MKDIYLKPETIGADVVILNGALKLTGGLDNAVYLSLFVPAWPGNAISESSEQYISEIQKIIATRILNNQTRLDMIEEAKNSLDWMVSDGIVDRFEIDAEIPKVGILYLSVKAYEPNHDDTTNFVYALNWNYQKEIIRNQKDEESDSETRIGYFIFTDDDGNTFVSDDGKIYLSDSYLY